VKELEDFINKCHRCLLDGDSWDTNEARAYLASRKIDDSTIRSNRIGYCPQKDVLHPAIARFGVSDPKDKRDYSWFITGRLVVPIMAEFGELVAFATRPPSKEKGCSWWNLPSPFKKGEHLFLLSDARRAIFEKDKVYIVEGYIDAIMLHQAGLTNSCSLMGTALTLRKISLIARYCQRVCFCFDVDDNEAGQRALRKSVSLLRRFNFCSAISVIDGLPVGQDPDEYVKANGIKQFLGLERQLSQEEIEMMCAEAA